MTNSLGVVAPVYVTPADPLSGGINFPSLGILVLSTGTYISDQPTLDNLVAASVSNKLPLIYSPTAPPKYALPSTLNAAKVASNPTDGQLLSYSATLGIWVPTNPTGASEVAYASNITGTVTTLTGATGGAGTIVDIPGCAINLAPSAGRPVRIEYGAVISQQTVAGGGTIFLLLYETTSGNVLVDSQGQSLPNVLGVPAVNLALPKGSYEVGAITTTRTFKLSAYIYSAASVAPAVQLANTVDHATFVRAVAG